MVRGGRKPTALHVLVGTPLPGCPDRTTKRRTGFDFPCHCEAEGRGDRRECLWCNLLVSCADLYNVPGDSYVASLLGMTGGEIVRIRLRAAVNSVHTAERRGRRSLREAPQNAQGRLQAVFSLPRKSRKRIPKGRKRECCNFGNAPVK